MEKIVICLIILMTEISSNSNSVEKNCLGCHKNQQIPTGLIYKRYLQKYSTQQKMQTIMFNYLQNPKKRDSIMPKPFFYKFPMKNKSLLDKKNLAQSIKLFLEKFDVKNRLVLERK